MEQAWSETQIKLASSVALIELPITGGAVVKIIAGGAVVLAGGAAIRIAITGGAVVMIIAGGAVI